MLNSFFKMVSFLGFVLSLLASLGLLFFKQWAGAMGILVGAFWVFLNSYFLFQLLEMGLTPKTRQNDKILLFSVLKFPVLYMAGFFILKSRFFPLYGILSGLTLFVLAFLLAWLKFNLSEKELRNGIL